MFLGVQKSFGTEETAFFAQLESTGDYLATSRPTAVNLFWAIAPDEERSDTAARKEFAARDCIGTFGRSDCDMGRRSCDVPGHRSARAGLFDNVAGVLTHCNAGALVTVDYGTALMPIFAAHEAGRQIHVYVDETRPLLQGARLTAWELQQRGIPTTLICDSVAAQVMREGRVQAVDRWGRSDCRQRRHGE